MATAALTVVATAPPNVTPSEAETPMAWVALAFQLPS